MQRFEHGGDIYSLPNIEHDFSINCNPLGIPEAVLEELCARTDDYKLYPDPRCRRLRAAIGEHHGISPDAVLCGNGAADLIMRICASLRPSRTLVTGPTFSDYERCASVYGSEIVEYKLDPCKNFAIEEDILEALTPDLDMAFICTPNNPTGLLVPYELMERIADRCATNGIMLVVDECFLPFTEGRSQVERAASQEWCGSDSSDGSDGDRGGLLVLRAFTKLYSMAGLRLGYCVGAPELLARIEPFGAEWSCSIPAQNAGVTALAQEPDWTEKTRAVTRTEMEYLRSNCERLGIKVFPFDANYMLMQTERDLYGPLKERGLLVRDCSNYTGMDKTYIRIGCREHAANVQLITAMEEILNG